MVPQEHPTAQFEPLQKASTLRHLAATVAGPILWLVALILVSIVIYGRDAVELGVAVTLVGLVVSLAVSLIRRRSRLREEREAESA